MDSFSFALSGVRTYSIVVELAFCRRCFRIMAAWAGSAWGQKTASGYKNKHGSLECFRNDLLSLSCDFLFVLSWGLRPTRDFSFIWRRYFIMWSLIYMSMITCEYWMVYVVILIPLLCNVLNKNQFHLFYLLTDRDRFTTTRMYN